MSNISIYFNLGCQQPELEFVDVKLNQDNLLFIDPRLIEIQQDALSKKMQRRIEVFWAELIKAARINDIRRMEVILGGLKEPNETRLGYSSNKPHGNSVADKLKPKIIAAIQRNKAVRTGVLSHFCDVELFIEDVGSDRISDITTKIIKDVLIEFTQAQCLLHGIPMKKVNQDDIFDYTTVRWISKKVELPIHNGKPIIFVPKNIVRLEGVAGQNFRCFYRFAIREFIFNDKDMLEDVSASGEDGKILLKDVKSAYPPSKNSISNWMLKFGSMLVDFKSDILSDRIEPLNDGEIMIVIYNEHLRNAS